MCQSLSRCVHREPLNTFPGTFLGTILPHRTSEKRAELPPRPAQTWRYWHSHVTGRPPAAVAVSRAAAPDAKETGEREGGGDVSGAPRRAAACLQHRQGGAEADSASGERPLRPNSHTLGVARLKPWRVHSVPRKINFSRFFKVSVCDNRHGDPARTLRVDKLWYGAQVVVAPCRCRYGLTFTQIMCHTRICRSTETHCSHVWFKISSNFFVIFPLTGL